MIADRRLCLDRRQSRLVEENTPEAAWLLVGKGHEIPASEVKRLGLEMVDGRVQQQVPEQEQEPELAAVVQTPRPTRRIRRRPGAKPGNPAPEGE
jgi:hypothetical protein